MNASTNAATESLRSTVLDVLELLCPTAAEIIELRRTDVAETAVAKLYPVDFDLLPQWLSVYLREQSALLVFASQLDRKDRASEALIMTFLADEDWRRLQSETAKLLAAGYPDPSTSPLTPLFKDLPPSHSKLVEEQLEAFGVNLWAAANFEYLPELEAHGAKLLAAMESIVGALRKVAQVRAATAQQLAEVALCS